MFTEKALFDRLCQTPSPRKLGSRASQYSNAQMDVESDRGTPMDICSPTIDEEDLSSNSNCSLNAAPTLSDIYNRINEQLNPD